MSKYNLKIIKYNVRIFKKTLHTLKIVLNEELFISQNRLLGEIYA